MKYIAHRGLPTQALENTLESFRLAAEKGARHIECDVWLSSDRELVVVHDKTLDRTEQGTGLVSAHTALTLLERGVPTLSHVYGAIGDATLIVELKGAGTAEVLSAYFEKTPEEGGFSKQRIIVSSFMKPELLRLQRIIPDIPYAVLVYGMPSEDEIDLYRSWGMSAIHINEDGDDVTEALVRQVHDRGMEVWVYTVNTVERAEVLESYGVDGLFTDDITLFGRR